MEGNERSSGLDEEAVDAFFEAIGRNDAAGVRRLLEEQPVLLTACRAPAYAPGGAVLCTGLHAAVHANALDVACVLLDAGADTEARTGEGRTPLHEAIEFVRPAIVALLVERGAVVDVCAAAILGRIDRLCELLDADPALVHDRSTGLTPLGWAAYGNRVDSAHELLARGARMDDGELLCAASVGHVEVGLFLLEHGADPNEIDEHSGETALHVACACRFGRDQRAFVQMLLERGADPRSRDMNDETALHLTARLAHEAEEHGEPTPKPYREVLDILRRHGA